MKSPSNFERLVLGCMDSYDSNQILIFSGFSRSTVAPIGRKKVQALFFSRKKNTFGGELRLRRPSRQRRASRAPLGLPTPDPRSTLGQPSVNPRSTLGQRSVSSLAISDRFSLILQVSSIETEDKRTCVCKMVDFPIRKWDFRVCGWSGAFWEPLERKKEKTKCIYKICILLATLIFKILQIFDNLFSKILTEIDFFLLRTAFFKFEF